MDMILIIAGYLLAAIAFYYGAGLIVGAKKYTKTFYLLMLICYSVLFTLSNIKLRQEHMDTGLYTAIKVAFALFCIGTIVYQYIQRKKVT